MGRTAQVIVIIVRTTLLVAYRMENVIIMGVLALYTSLRFVKVNIYFLTQVSALSAMLSNLTELSKVRIYKVP